MVVSRRQYLILATVRRREKQLISKEIDGWRQFARVEAGIKGEITKPWRENDIHLRRLTSKHI